MLSVENVTSSYGRIQALHGVSLAVAAGEIVTLVGANGAGKTTLIRAISGVQPISGGRIMFENRSIDRMPAHARVALGIAQVPEGRQLFAPLSVEDNLKLGAWSRRDADIDAELAAVYALFPMLAARRGATCRHAVGRPAADAGDRTRPDGEAAAAAARRAFDGTCPDAGRADPRCHRGASNARA